MYAQYDDAAYAVDLAIGLADVGDARGAAAQIAAALECVAGAPYDHLVSDFRVYGSTAVASLAAGDGGRAESYMRLLLHLVEDMQDISSAELYAPA